MQTEPIMWDEHIMRVEHNVTWVEQNIMWAEHNMRVDYYIMWTITKTRLYNYIENFTIK